MQIDFSYKENWIHKVNPSLKLILMMFIFIYGLFIHNPTIMANLALLFLLLYFIVTGHPIKRVLLFSIPFILVFVSSTTTMVFFGKGETTLFQWGLVHITEESLLRGLHLGFRSLMFAAIGLIFALTTRPVFLFYSLMQHLKVKPKYAYSFMAGMRLFPIMFEEFQTLRYAFKIRGVKHKSGVKGFYEKLKRYSIPLLSQSIRRAHRIAVAMEAKRFSMTKKRTYYYVLTFSKYDMFFVMTMVSLLGIAYYIGIYIPYFTITDVRHS